jgi:hypothetical protein
MNSQDQPQSDLSGQAAGELVAGLIRATTLTLEVFLHRGIGSRCIDCGFAGIPIIIVFANIFQPSEGSPLHWFMAVYGFLWLVKFAWSLVQRFRSRNTAHSMYSGQPWLSLLLRSWNEEYIKHLEAIAVILLGFLIRMVNIPLGDYLIFAAVLMLVRGLRFAYLLHHRALDLHDSAIEQKCIAQKFQEMQEH